MKIFYILWLLSVIITFFLFEVKADDNPLVHISQGSLEGKKMKSRDGKEFFAFLGIPYAAPPVGPLRFMPPHPPQNWTGVRNATKEGKKCTQRKPGGQEDCLFLNVFTHNIEDKTQSTAVMFYIHGGGFYLGSSALDEHGPEYLMDKNIVLVTIQYRLGVFGFLSTEDSVIPGNMGLKDQLYALKWVHENIRKFGGDPSKVTIFGNSAGSASVHLHMISSKSKNLFARAISQSGTALSGFAFIGKGTSKNITYQLMQNLRCPSNSSEEVLNCLQSKEAALIQQEYQNLQDSGYEIKKILFRPVVEIPSDHAFLTENPLNATTDKPWLVGVNKNEGLFKIKLKYLNTTKLLIQTEYNRFFPKILFFDDTCSKPAEVASQIYDFYFKNVSTDNEIIESLEQIISDAWFVGPTIQSLHLHKGKAYFYLFDHVGEHSFTQVIQGPQGFGVSHLDELHYLFTQSKFYPAKLNDEDMKISKLLIELWVAFAKEGNPTPYPIISNTTIGEKDFIWEPSTKNDLKFLHIHRNSLIMSKNFFENRMTFWNNLNIRDNVK